METAEYTYGILETSFGIIVPIFFIVFLYYTISTIRNKDHPKINKQNNEENN